MTKKIIFLFLIVFVSLVSFFTKAAAPYNLKHNLKVEKSFEITREDFYELEVYLTAYSSSIDETDDDPFITSLGTYVREGVVATNLLPFKTKIIIPELFGDKVFVVEDRMHKRLKNVIDIWMPSKEKALEFGIVKTKVKVLVD